jgi:hypothetical protein
MMTTLVGCCVAAVAAASAAGSATTRAIDPVLQWNRNLLSIVRTAGAQPATVHPTRSFAMMHVAIFDAVNAIARTHSRYAAIVRDASGRASQDAAAASAAHDVLVALYPSFSATLDAELQQSLTEASHADDQADGVRIGQEAARQILALRNHDGSSAPPPPYTFGTAPGDYQSTPPNFPPQPQFTHWAAVTPFALRRPDQFRPAPPPALDSDRYGDALSEVQSLGVAGGTTATPDETQVGRFWNGAIQNYWNEITQTASTAHHLTTAENARLFALLNVTLADSVIAFYDAKYTYNFWRPVTAIRAADIDGNPDTIGDSNWLPDATRTAADPSYPGAHAVISAAAAEVLRSILKRDRFDFDVTSEALPGVTRSFRSLSAAADEAALSRIFAGQHFRFDEITGQHLGRDVAAFVLDHYLTRRRGHQEQDSVLPQVGVVIGEEDAASQR